MADKLDALWQSLYKLLIYQASDSNAVVHSVNNYNTVKASLAAFLKKLGTGLDPWANNLGQRREFTPGLQSTASMRHIS